MRTKRLVFGTTLLCLLHLNIYLNGAEVIKKQMVYKTINDIELSVDIFYLEENENEEISPAIAFFHGGGWVYGSPQEFHGACERFARNGFVTFSFQYRLSINDDGTYPHPEISPIESVKDARSAIRWLRNNADKLNIDPNKIIAGGQSAGGQLALSTALFDNINEGIKETFEVKKARILALLGDSVTTDHISPAGSILKDGPAGIYLTEHGVKPYDFNSFGSRRGNHEVMMRGTFANIRIRNELVPGVEGGYTQYIPTGEQMSIYDAAMKYVEEKTPLVIIAGKEYGTGSSRDWAAKGTLLQGVKAVVCESFERIHRSNLIGMGVMPLEFPEGVNRKTLNLTGKEIISLEATGPLTPGFNMTMFIEREDGSTDSVDLISRVDTAGEMDYFKNGGILQFVLRRIKGN